MQVNQEDLAVVIDFQTAVENDKESLSRYVNRRVENLTENAPWVTEHEERPKVLIKTR